MTHPTFATQRTTATDRDLDWLLDRLIEQVPGARHAVVLSDDGLVISQSRGIERGVAEIFDGGGTHQVIVELARLWLFISAAGHGTHLAVLAEQDVDAEVMAVAMHTLVLQVGRHLGTETRAPAKQEGADAGEPLGRRVP